MVGNTAKKNYWVKDYFKVFLEYLGMFINKQCYSFYASSLLDKTRGRLAFSGVKFTFCYSTTVAIGSWAKVRYAECSDVILQIA